MSVVYPISVAKSYSNSRNRRNSKTKKKYWTKFGFDANYNFTSERVKGFLWFKPRVKLYYWVTDDCVECGKEVRTLDTNQHTRIICNHCELRAP